MKTETERYFINKGGERIIVMEGILSGNSIQVTCPCCHATHTHSWDTGIKKGELVVRSSHCAVQDYSLDIDGCSKVSYFLTDSLKQALKSNPEIKRVSWNPYMSVTQAVIEAIAQASVEDYGKPEEWGKFAKSLPDDCILVALKNNMLFAGRLIKGEKVLMKQGNVPSQLKSQPWGIKPFAKGLSSHSTGHVVIIKGETHLLDEAFNAISLDPCLYWIIERLDQARQLANSLARRIQKLGYKLTNLDTTEVRF